MGKAKSASRAKRCWKVGPPRKRARKISANPAAGVPVAEIEADAEAATVEADETAIEDKRVHIIEGGKRTKCEKFRPLFLEGNFQ